MPVAAPVGGQHIGIPVMVLVGGVVSGMVWPVCRLTLADRALLKHSETSTALAREGSGKALICEKRMVPVKDSVVTSGCERSEASAPDTCPVT